MLSSKVSVSIYFMTSVPTPLDYSESAPGSVTWSLVWVTKSSTQYKEKCIIYTFGQFLAFFLGGGGDFFSLWPIFVVELAGLYLWPPFLGSGRQHWWSPRFWFLKTFLEFWAFCRWTQGIVLWLKSICAYLQRGPIWLHCLMKLLGSAVDSCRKFSVVLRQNNMSKFFKLSNHFKIMHLWISVPHNWYSFLFHDDIFNFGMHFGS